MSCLLSPPLPLSSIFPLMFLCDSRQVAEVFLVFPQINPPAIEKQRNIETFSSREACRLTTTTVRGNSLTLKFG